MGRPCCLPGRAGFVDLDTGRPGAVFAAAAGRGAFSPPVPCGFPRAPRRASARGKRRGSAPRETAPLSAAVWRPSPGGASAWKGDGACCPVRTGCRRPGCAERAGAGGRRGSGRAQRGTAAAPRGRSRASAARAVRAAAASWWPRGCTAASGLSGGSRPVVLIPPAPRLCLSLFKISFCLSLLLVHCPCFLIRACVSCTLSLSKLSFCVSVPGVSVQVLVAAVLQGWRR